MTGKWKLARIGLWSAMRTGFLIFAAAGFLMGLFWSVVFAFFASLVTAAASGRDPGFGPGAVVIIPMFGALFAGFFGAAASLLAALVYNLAAGAFGGLEVEIDTGDEPVQPREKGNIAAPGAVYTKTRRIWRPPSAAMAARRKRTVRRGGTAEK